MFGGLFNKANPLYTGKEPWHDIRVREAMNLVIDRGAINKLFFGGVGTVDYVMGNAIAPPAVGSKLKIDYDLDRAKKLLKDAGLEKGFEFDFISHIPAMADVVTAIASSWEAIGLRPKIKPMDQAVFRNSVLKDETNNIMYGWTNTLRPTWQSRFEKFFYSKVLGFGIYYDEHLDEEYEKLIKTGDAALRDKILADAAIYLREKWAAVPIVTFPQTLYAGNSKTIADWLIPAQSTWSTFEYVVPA
jgi:peptide/nickel transport system substrate-binding protein